MSGAAVSCRTVSARPWRHSRKVRQKQKKTARFPISSGLSLAYLDDKKNRLEYEKWFKVGTEETLSDSLGFLLTL